MQGIKRKKIAGFAALGMAAALLAGCEVDSHKNGESKDVKISTPFGGMRVKTNQASVTEGIGLPAYPGAQPAKKDNGNDDNESADVDMNFGSFQFRVKTASFRTGDPPEKVEAFYRDGMKRFGDVIECRDGHPLGTPARTMEGLTCDNRHGGHVDVDAHPSKDKLELKAGSMQHQHLVEIDPDGSGTRFGLVVLDLPEKFFSDNGDESKQ
jgi:hypothetical protein